MSDPIDIVKEAKESIQQEIDEHLKLLQAFKSAIDDLEEAGFAITYNIETGTSLS